jgi:hypothetical protein
VRSAISKEKLVSTGSVRAAVRARADIDAAPAPDVSIGGPAAVRTTRPLPCGQATANRESPEACANASATAIMATNATMSERAID